MQVITTIVKTKYDPTPAIEKLGIKGELIELDPVAFIILEGGMVGGKTSVTLHCTSKDGGDYCIQMGAGMFETLAGALRGAEGRFQDLRAGLQ